MHFACAEGEPWLFSGTSFRRWPLFTADAARTLNLSTGAVKQRVSRSRARLKKAVTLDEI